MDRKKQQEIINEEMNEKYSESFQYPSLKNKKVGENLLFLRMHL